MTYLRLACAALSLIGLTQTAVACAPPKGPFLEAVAAEAKDCRHPLCGQILAPGRSCPPERLVQDITEALGSHGLVILGEEHDNPIHHRLQAAAIAQFAAGEKSLPGVVFEQINTDQQAGVDRYNAARTSGSSLFEFKRLLDWSASGWARYSYDPLLSAVVEARLPVYAGDVAPGAIRSVASDGKTALDAKVSEGLGLDLPLGPKLDAASIAEISRAHCGMMPEPAFTGMAFAQRYRDAHLADALLQASAADGGAFLVAGAGHARTDRGVPWYVRARAPAKRVVSIAFVEVEDGDVDAAHYLPLDPEGQPAADYLVFTPRTERPDPCAAMKTR